MAEAVDVTITIQTGAAITARQAGDAPSTYTTQGGDWLIQLIDPASTTQEVGHEYRGPEPSATFQLISGETWHISAARLDQNGAQVGAAIMLQDYVAGSGPQPPIDVPTAIAVS